MRFTLAILATLTAGAAAWTPEVQTRANLGGQVTSLSVASSVIPGKTAVSLPIDSFDACAKACKDFSNGNGCNTIVFCANGAGCGNAGDCTQQALGPFGSAKCTEDGRFPYAVSLGTVEWGKKGARAGGGWNQGRLASILAGGDRAAGGCVDTKTNASRLRARGVGRARARAVPR